MFPRELSEGIPEIQPIIDKAYCRFCNHLLYTDTRDLVLFLLEEMTR